MPTGKKVDFFLSRRGSVAAVAREVADVLTAKGYAVIVQDYDIPIGDSFVEAMHEAIKSVRDLIVLYTRDYEASPYTRKEFTSSRPIGHKVWTRGGSSCCAARRHRCSGCWRTMSTRIWSASTC